VSKIDLSEELESAQQKCIKTTCCRSYQLPKGRCYDCIERDEGEER